MRDNLILRGNTYHVRLALPEDVRTFFGDRKLLSRSLKTGLQQEAKDRARVILLDWKNQITQARATTDSRGDTWRQAVHEEGVGIQNDRKEAVTAIYTPSGKPAEFDLVAWTHEALAIHASLSKAGHSALADRVMLSIQNFLDNLEQGFDHSSAMAWMNELINTDAELGAEIAQDDFNLSDEETAEARAIILSPTRWTPKSPITKQMLDSWAAHLETQIKTAKTRDRLKQSVQRFSDYLTKDGTPLTFDTVHSFLGTLPAARTTRANYLWSLRKFWKWANKYQPAFREKYAQQPCPFDGHELPRTGTAAGVKRSGFTKEQIEYLHRQAKDKGSTDLANLITFAAYTGARLEEIGRLKPEATIFDSSGEPIGFKITESKTDAGIRDMPLHPDLVPLFKELSANAAANDGYLFPGGHNKYGNRLDGLSKQFGRLKTKNGYGKDRAFHSIRHSVTSMLHQSGVRIEVLPYILGHETGAFTLAQYSKGASFEQKQQAINLLSFSF